MADAAPPTDAHSPRPRSALRGPAPWLVLYDGSCGLCHTAVAFILHRDRAGRFAFAAQQSGFGRAQLARHGLGTAPLDTLVLIGRRGVHTRSGAVLRIASELGPPWSLAVVALALPPALRDALYARVARSRLRWFGTRATCIAPTSDVRGRFLDADETPALHAAS